MLRPETSRWQGYVEDTITIDWQTPPVMEKARALADRLRRRRVEGARGLPFVRDEIAHTADAGRDELPCRASQVLEAGTGIGFSKSHLLAALLRAVGVPAGFCYQVLRRGRSCRRHAAVRLQRRSTCRASSAGSRSTRAATSPGSTPSSRPTSRGSRCTADPARGEWIYPLIWTRPAAVVVDLLSRNTSLAKIAEHVPEELPGVAAAEASAVYRPLKSGLRFSRNARTPSR